jgi:hypothetical protein
MKVPLYCNQCEVECGDVEVATYDYPEEIHPDNESFIDTEGNFYCSQECLDEHNRRNLDF